MALFFRDAMMPTRWAKDVRIEIAEGLITSIEVNAIPAADDERHSIGLPGISNVHSHAFQRSFAGLTEQRATSSDSFWTWREVMYGLVGQLQPDDVEVIAAQAYVEMLEAGFVHVGEFHYLHHDFGGARFSDPAEMAGRIAAAAQESGIGLTLLPVFYAHSGFGGIEPNSGQLRFVNDLDGFGRLIEGSRVAIKDVDGAILGIAPHSLRAVLPHELDAVLMMNKGGPVHIHVAEQIKEVEDCIAWSNARPVEWLLEHAPVDERWCLIHATHMTEGETTRLAQSGAIAGLCPVTEANLGDGIFHADEFQTAGGEYGVGTDSNVCIGLADELRQLEYSQRLTRRARNVMATPEQRSTGSALYQAALSGGARATGRGVVGFSEGAVADIVTLDLGSSTLAGRNQNDALSSWIFAGRHTEIDCVWARGRKVVERGRHQKRHGIGQRFRGVVRRLLAS